MIQTVSKTQWPDFSEFGLYLLPRNYQVEYGFQEDHSPGRCLLLLDTQQRVTKEGSKRANLRKILHNQEEGVSLYVILPSEKRRGKFQYPGPSELLQNLELAYVARSQVVTPAQTAAQFKSALSSLRVDAKNYLDFSHPVGVNSDGDTVYSSPYGRYIERYKVIDGDPQIIRVRSSELPLSACLYAIDEDGNIDETALFNCVKAFLSSAKVHLYNNDNAREFAQIIFQKKPKDIEFSDSSDIANSMIDALISEAPELELNHWHKFNNTVLLCESVETLQLTLTHTNYQEFIYELISKQDNRHRLSSSLEVLPVFRPSLPTPLCSIIARMLIPNDNLTKVSVYSPCIGAGSLLSGFKGPIVFHVNEPDRGNYKLLTSFVERSEAVLTDNTDKPSYFVTNKELSLTTPSSDYEYSLALLPSGVSPVSTLIPFLDPHGGRHVSMYTDLLDQSVIIEVLLEREAKGRSVFIGPIEKESRPGRVGENSVRLLQYLQAYYYDVSVVDLHQNMIIQNSAPVPCRLYIIGEAKQKPSNSNILNERSGHITADFSLPVFTNYEQLIQFEQAIRLISVSKRRPDIDSIGVDSAIDSNEDGLTIEERSLISLFYTLKPKNKDVDVDPDASNEKTVRSKNSSTPTNNTSQPVFVDLEGIPIKTKEVKVLADEVVKEPRDEKGDQDDLALSESNLKNNNDESDDGALDDTSEPESDIEHEKRPDEDILDNESVDDESVDDESVDDESVDDESVDDEPSSESDEYDYDDEDEASDDVGLYAAILGGDVEEPESSEYDLSVLSGNIEEDESILTTLEDNEDTGSDGDGDDER